VEESWARLIGRNRAQPDHQFKTEDLATKIACQVPPRVTAGRNVQRRSMGGSQEQKADGTISSSSVLAAPSRRWWIRLGTQTEEERCRPAF